MRSTNIQPEPLFVDCVELASEVCRAERKHIEEARLNGHGELFRDTFGPRLLSRRMYSGLLATRRQFFADPERIAIDIDTPLKTLDAEIKGNQEILHVEESEHRDEEGAEEGDL